MNSYPSELLLQLAPLMFVAGLEAFPPPVPTTTATAPATGSSSSSNSASPPPANGFALLAHRLRKTLGVHRKSSVWDPERGKDFDVLLVDKTVRFPPRKILPPTSSPIPSDPLPHSPLSPLTPTSPLYPDGLIAPIWVRKHTTLIPSVFVLFLRLPDVGQQGALPTEREVEEQRERDAELAREIAERKRGTAERGIKLTVVLLATRAMLDDTSLDARLSSLRRLAQLDSRAALFVLSPVSPSELHEFVASLRSALHPVAQAYYANHSKTTRRKRSRPHQATGPPPQGGGPPRPLRPEGWAVRYEYKMGVFAEFRGEWELARKHFEDCWSALLDMFSSTAILPPRTKRWAEAKVLADTVSFKIVKFYLYQSSSHAAVRQFRGHLSRFTDLSRGWGMGEETVEFWGWAARQYRLLSELLEAGLASSHPVLLPSLAPAPAGGLNTHYPHLQQPGQPLPIAGSNPSDALVGPAYWYLCAAECTRERRKRWLALVEQTPEEARSHASFQNEKKVDHQAVVRELYTKAYELFKKHASAATAGAAGDQQRLPFYVAFRVAEAYFEAGEWETSVRFFERTAKLYRREHWPALLLPILRMWHQCAKQLADVQAVVRLTLELMAAGEEGLEEELMAVLGTTTAPPAASGDGVLVLDLGGGESLMSASVTFWEHEVYPGEAASFQIQIAAPPTLDLSTLPISALRIELENEQAPLVISHVDAEEFESIADGAMQCVDIGEVSEPKDVSANLRWSRGEVKVFRGTWTSAVPVELRVVAAVLCISQGTWNIEVPLDPNILSIPAPSPARWLQPPPEKTNFLKIPEDSRTTCHVIVKPHDFHITISHEEPAYINERYPITIEVANLEERDLEAVIDVLLQPSEDDDRNQVAIDEHESSGFIKAVSFGIIKEGEVASKILWLTSSGSLFDRTLDLSIQTRTVDPNDDSPISSTNSKETLRTIVVPIIQPVACTVSTTYSRQVPAIRPLSDSDGSARDSSSSLGASFTVTFSCMGPWPLTVQSVRYVPAEEQSDRLEMSSCSLEDEDQWPLTWEGDAAFQAALDFRITASRTEESSLDGPDSESHVPAPGGWEVTWLRHHTASTSPAPCITLISLPPLLAPANAIIGILTPPYTVYMHSPFAMRLAVQNYHTTRSAAVSVQVDSSESFSIPGPRKTRLTALAPGASVDVLFRVYPTMLGMQKLPPITILEQPLSVNQPVVPPSNSQSPVIEYRRSYEEEEEDFSAATGAPLLLADPSDPDRAALEPSAQGITVLVLPYSQTQT
ncbi:hypothetical protein CALCODRAFT_432256 [Calocera cornea HHB12733]|uniref:Uncharacterized protein n=1 Tax=Calocera cornea HHB12733 TaxID=1353952 RepID=A0A165H042_9BASI|nr:hypothetical protein CALCODRAFT_432256 [Calocera cornea HHB12733]